MSPDPALAALRASIDTPTVRNIDPLPDPNPASTAIARINSMTRAVDDRPETFTTAQLARLRGAALELARACDRAVCAR